MSDKSPDALWLMLGEIRGDLKWLVEERRATSRRMDDIEAGIEMKIDQHDERLSVLENFKVRIGVFVTIIGILVPAIVTATFKYFGLL